MVGKRSPRHTPKRWIALVAAGLTIAAQGHTSAQRGPLFRTGIDLVSLGVTVTDRPGDLVSGLRIDDFEVFEDGIRQTLTEFAVSHAPDAGLNNGPAMHLGVLLDVSESMSEDLAFVKTASIKFLNTLLDAVDITVVDFATEVRSARFSQRDFPRVVARIRGQTAGGPRASMTALYDAIGVYLGEAAGDEGRKIMLLYTDGGDTRSSLSYPKLLEFLKASDVTVYAIGALEHQPSSAQNQQRMVLQSIARTTGGEAFFPSTIKELDGVYARIMAEIRGQYLLGYQSSNRRADGAWRKVEIRVVKKDGGPYRIRARQGYFAPHRKP